MDLSSLEKGLALLDQIGLADRPLTPAELAEQSGLNRSSTYRLCDVLERGGWIERRGDATARSTIVTVGSTSLGFSVLLTNKFDTPTTLQPIIAELAHSVSETIHVGVLDHTHLVHVAGAVPDDGPNMAAQIGSRVPAHATALGKALLATKSREELLQLYLDEDLPVKTSATISSRTDLLRALDGVASVGYALDEAESREGVRCVGVPVFGPEGVAVLALSVTSMPARLDDERLGSVVEATAETARLATTAIGGHAPAGWPLAIL
ncbi:MAG: IclR family transcriptional regulator, acetate operon repressor [Thermoleophilaceae bacterium]|nr:IclR family transcriptional regulator, acetate operon repressor [Thermoleophilaceae bacterium]MEA2408694.1 IclR family transcriptional regulator, acetate operon repressor [Thermoleophilaceae bacterium]